MYKKFFWTSRFNPNLKYHLKSYKVSFPIYIFQSLAKAHLSTNGFSQSASEFEDLSDQDVPKKGELSAFQISHPWPEWVDLMECLMKRGYFDAEGNPFRSTEIGSKESNLIRTACLNFGRDRFDLLRLGWMASHEYLNLILCLLGLEYIWFSH